MPDDDVEPERGEHVDDDLIGEYAREADLGCRAGTAVGMTGRR